MPVSTCVNEAVGLSSIGLSSSQTPSNVTPPVVTGITYFGKTMITSNGIWDIAGGYSLTYQWQSSSNGGANYLNILGATSNAYVIDSSTEGLKIRCVVTATYSGGSISANSNGVENWIPSDTALNLWIDASDSGTITESSGSVSAWSDKSGNSNDLSQATGSQQPETGVASIGGLNAIEFKAANDEILVAADSATLKFDPNPVLMFAVLNYGSFVNQGAAFNTIFGKQNLASGALKAFGLRQASSNLVYQKLGSVGAANVGGDIGTFNGQDSILSSDASPYNSYLNGVLSYTYNGTYASDSTEDFSVGGEAINNSKYTDVSVGEIILKSGTLSTADREKFEGYMAHKWNLTDNLPSGHTYKSSPPTV